MHGPTENTYLSIASRSIGICKENLKGNVQKPILIKNTAFMDKERRKSKSQMESIKACCQDAAWASFSLRAEELGTEEELQAG